MQTVSQEYKDSMKSPLRNRGYIQVNFGIFNESVQSSAQFEDTADTYIYYSDDSRAFDGQTEDFVYATLEHNFFKVDGSMKLLPPRTQPNLLQNSGVVSEELVDDGNVVFTINLNQTASFYGLTLDFGENYPVNFHIIYGSDREVVLNNSSSLYVCDKAFTDVSTIQIVFFDMLQPNTRARVYSVRFGIGYSFGNDDVMESQLRRVISPISEFIPQFDFSVTLKNYDHYFDVDNPNSAINFLTTDNIVSVQYGYELNDGTIEWVPGQQLRCTEWESDDKTAVIRCTDILRNLDGEFNGTAYNSAGVTFGAMAETVLAAAGITDYTIDPSMYEKSTPLPIPSGSYKELLQMIANAACCVLCFDRDGRVVFRKLMENSPTVFYMQKVDMLSYPRAIKKDLVKDITIKYASWYKNGSERNILSEQISVTANEERTYHFTEPLYSYRVVLNGTNVTSTAVQGSGDYYLTVKFPSTDTVTLDIYATPYTVIPRQYKHTIGSHGASMVWNNPLVGDFYVAEPLVEWVGDFYSTPVEYQYESRGNPELDVGDVIRQDNEYMFFMRVLLSEYVLDFKQSFHAQALTYKLRGGA